MPFTIPFFFKEVVAIVLPIKILIEVSKITTAGIEFSAIFVYVSSIEKTVKAINVIKIETPLPTNILFKLLFPLASVSFIFFT